LRILSGIFLIFFLVPNANAGPHCELSPSELDPYEFYTRLAEAFLPIDDVITAVARNTSVCDIVEGRSCTIKNGVHSCFAKKENAVFSCRDKKGYTIGENVSDSKANTGSMRLCYRGVKEMLERLYGPEVREKLVSKFAKNAGNDFNNLKQYFTKVKPSSAEAKTVGTVCVLNGNKYGHIEMLGSDGNYYSDFNQGPRSIAGRTYTKLACYVPTEYAINTLRMRVTTRVLTDSDLVLPREGGKLGEDQNSEVLDAE
jgi:hypothetical protein